MVIFVYYELFLLHAFATSFAYIMISRMRFGYVAVVQILRAYLSFPRAPRLPHVVPSQAAAQRHLRSA